MWWWAGVVAAVAGAGELVRPEPTPTAELGAASEAVAAAEQDLAAGRYAEAARQFEALAEASSGVRYRFLEAVARYEEGQLVRAEAAAAKVLTSEPLSAAALALQGLIWVDLGRGVQALELLERAEGRARDVGDGALVARVLLHRGLAHADLGQDAAAAEAWRQAASTAERASLHAVRAEALAQLAALEHAGSADLIGRTAESLRAGDLVGADAQIAAMRGGSAREQVQAALAAGMVARARGRWAEAASALASAVARARDLGLVREVAAAELEHARVLRLQGEVDEAKAALSRALALVEGGSHRLRQLDVHAALAELALEQGALSEAGGQVAAVRALVAQVEQPMAALRLAELEGRLAFAQGSPEAGAEALERAAEGWSRRGAWAEAARVGAAEVLWLEASGRSSVAAVARALGWFERASDRQGPAHVAIARGLGLARSGALDGALEAFGAAEQAAAAASSPALVTVARANAAEVWVRLGHQRTGLPSGATEIVAAHERFVGAQASYDAARRAFDARRYAEAERAFVSARAAFEALGEVTHATAARRGAAWARWNAASGSVGPSAIVTFSAVQQEAEGFGDAELAARAAAGAALVAAELRSADAVGRLRRAVVQVEAQGLSALAGRCWSYLAELEPAFDDRLRAARAAHALGGRAGVYAMYVVALHAYQQDAPELAVELIDEVTGDVGDLGSSLAEVRAAALERIGGVAR